mmetsp:Transcript_8380/g.9080  ORF Transcript_8380/g.9080 Transcript_8380/m.9080 type:complete len:294 (-) Transcript_8380:219-1100(-)
MEESGATIEEKVKIVDYCLKSAPIGELKDVYGDLAKLVGEDVMGEEKIQEAITLYREAHFSQLLLGEEDLTVMTAAGRADPEQCGIYVDPNLKKVFRLVDPLKGQTELVGDYENPLEDAAEQLRARLQAKLEEYLNSTYVEETASGVVYGRSDPESDGVLYEIFFSCPNANLKNFWTGEWRSTWNFTVLPGKIQVHGSVHTDVHYFEEGNVQFKQKKEFDHEFDFDPASMDIFAAALIEFIRECEKKVQQNISEFYGQLPDYFFKSMRRKLPVTGNRFDWNVNYHKMVDTLHQ